MLNGVTTRCQGKPWESTMPLSLTQTSVFWLISLPLIKVQRRRETLLNWMWFKCKRSLISHKWDQTKRLQGRKICTMAGIKERRQGRCSHSNPAFSMMSTKMQINWPSSTSNLFSKTSWKDLCAKAVKKKILTLTMRRPNKLSKILRNRGANLSKTTILSRKK